MKKIHCKAEDAQTSAESLQHCVDKDVPKIFALEARPKGWKSRPRAGVGLLGRGSKPSVVHAVTPSSHDLVERC